MPLNQKTLDEAFAVLERAAINGERCPTRDAGIGPELTTPLARAGRIRVEVYARNYRVVQILTGPHAGKRTKEPPSPGWEPYLIIGLQTVHRGRAHQLAEQRRAAPSHPLSAAAIRNR